MAKLKYPKTMRAALVGLGAAVAGAAVLCANPCNETGTTPQEAAQKVLEATPATPSNLAGATRAVQAAIKKATEDGVPNPFACTQGEGGAYNRAVTIVNQETADHHIPIAQQLSPVTPQNVLCYPQNVLIPDASMPGGQANAWGFNVETPAQGNYVVLTPSAANQSDCQMAQGAYYAFGDTDPKTPAREVPTTEQSKQVSGQCAAALNQKAALQAGDREYYTSMAIAAAKESAEASAPPLILTQPGQVATFESEGQRKATYQYPESIGGKLEGLFSLGYFEGTYKLDSGTTLEGKFMVSGTEKPKPYGPIEITHPDGERATISFAEEQMDPAQPIRFFSKDKGHIDLSPMDINSKPDSNKSQAWWYRGEPAYEGDTSYLKLTIYPKTYKWEWTTETE